MSDENNQSLLGKVLLSGFDVSRNNVFDLVVSIDDYYGESHPVIDDERYRSERNIRSVHGRIFDYDGKLDQEFSNEYSSDGVYVRSRVVHADGTIIED